ncbi:hypothetical protein DFJ58DRAFT_727163 [Suillus subalutaceus]|uniref:uncharacterized protein n=1 Tax=Suillus subalutaceus TaxID=48586 RepID=UPI001B877F91|nr:uncharacterized protein DFJ58DRAFT_727163 [Suillus subalutaceus]KAG1856331.1 hypothetical protein DFJ58DRAFT_727163 [Suillus subalutaceus]
MYEDETIQVTLKYDGAKGGRLISGMTSKTKALHDLLADLNILRAHRPKGENIRQEGAAFFLLWPHPVHAPIPLVEGTLYKRWVSISRGSPELDAVKKELSILPSILLAGTRGANLSPLGPKHTIELPRTEGMSPLAENFPLSSTSDRSDLQKPAFTTEVVQGKRPRSDSINEQSVLSPPFGSDGNNVPSSTPLLKRIRTEQHLPIQNSTAEGKHTLDGFSTGEYRTTQAGDKIPQSRYPISRVPLKTTPQQPLLIPPYHTKPFPGSPGVSNSSTPTGPRPPGDRGTINRLSLELSKVRSQLTTLKHCEKGISEELIRLGVPQPKNEENSTLLAWSHMEARLILLEIELQQERTQRLHAERMLSEVERECRVPFVVPALFQAFSRISELGHHEQTKASALYD